MDKKLNFLFLFPDQHRGDWMPYNDETFKKLKMESLPLRMPNIQNLMNEGTTFTNTVSSSPLCAPARACLAAGVRYDKCNVPNNSYDYPLNKKTFYTVLKENGYNVGGVGKFDLHKKTLFWGKDGWIDDLGTLGFTHAIDNEGKIDGVTVYDEEKGVRRYLNNNDEVRGPYLNYLKHNNLDNVHIQDMKNRSKNKYNSDCTNLPDEAYCDNWLTQNGVKMIKDFSKGKPWFLVVNFTGPHTPWDITSSMKKRWENVDFPVPHEFNAKSNEEINAVRQNYAAMLENIDKNIGLLIEEVRNRGELDNTVIIYSADHGEMLGDFNMFEKSKWQRGSDNIPLVIKIPGMKKVDYSNCLVELQDITSTILDYAGLKMDEAVDSISLRKILEGKTKEHRQYQVSAFGESNNNWKMISDGNYKLVIKNDKDIKLFNVIDDPWELKDISNENTETVNKLKTQLSNEINC